VWPHNPRTYTIRYQRQVAVHKVPFGRYAMQDLGLTRRVMTGEGEFYGPRAYEEFKKLASIFYEGGPGPLIHPVWQTSQAYLVELSLAQEPRKDYVRYTFTFWETYEKYSQSLTGTKPAETVRPKTYILAQGETFWSVARDHGLTEEELLDLNPQVKNPSLVTGGSALYVK
ncbi:MAG: DNA circularization N-terminal domain-containing protein, partial [Ruminiclostridium sp.]|nr:DNA circularization N-terminal domain-containing protein [Ruminiclostridium sp.]